MQTSEGLRCNGSLCYDENFVYPSGEDETKEGIVYCRKCHSKYPIISGVLILVPQIKNYLTTRLSEIITTAISEGDGISEMMVGWLRNQGYDLLDTGYHSSEWANAGGMGRYISAHYDDLSIIAAEQLGIEHPIAQFLADYNHPNLYDRLENLAIQEKGLGLQAIDIGANVGGLLLRLARQFKFVWGVDYGFRQVLTSRRILLHHPTPLLTYRLYNDGPKYQERSIKSFRCSNVEIIVSAGEYLPFNQASFDLVNCANVIDLVSSPNDLVAESLRVLKDGCCLLITDPYYWGSDRTPVDAWYSVDEDGNSTSGFRTFLNSRKGNDIESIDEQNFVLWPLRANRRKIDIWLNDIFKVKKLQRK